MHSSHLLLEEPIRMVSILEPSKPVSLFFLLLFNILFFLFSFFLSFFFKYVLRFQNFFPAMTKIVGTLGPKSRSVEVISACLKAGMSGMCHCLFLLLHCYSNIFLLFLTLHRFLNAYLMWDYLLFFFIIAVARFDFSWDDPEYHQETLENLKNAIKTTKKLCAVSFFFYLFLFF